MNDPRTFVTTALIALAGALLLAAQACALAQTEQRPAFGRPPPGVIVSFEGGSAADNLLAVGREISKFADGVAKEQYNVQPGETLCDILLARDFPPPCDGEAITGMRRVIEEMNPQIRRFFSGVRPGDTLTLPKLQVESYRAEENFSSFRQLPRWAQDLKEHARSQNLDEQIFQRAPGLYTIRRNAFRIFVPTRDDDTADGIFEALTPMISKDLIINIVYSKERPAKLNILPAEAEKIKELCEKEHDFGREIYRYSDLVEGDPDAKSLAEGLRSAVGQTVTVVTIDTRLNASPNLYPCYGEHAPAPAVAWKCKWVGFKYEHHATLLASIIASQQGQFGFVGLAEKVHFDPFVWATPDPNEPKLLIPGTDKDLANKLREGGTPPLKIYLAATDFGPFRRNRSSDAILPNAEKLKDAAMLGVISKVRPLLVVAAGQPDSQDEGEVREIGKHSNMSPQAFGDWQNVIVVTACEECTRKKVKLWPFANIGRKGDYTVHVAAPGGKSLPGWVSEDGIGAAPGTSQSAAYVAGVVANMISAFPDFYTSPALVKSRIQATSWPFPPQDGNVHDDAKKLTAGLVDPILALLNPRKHWYKVSGSWREAKAWNPAKLTLKRMDTGTKFEMEGSGLLRFVRTEDVGDGVKRWTIYEDLFQSQTEKDPVEPGTVGRSDLVSVEMTNAYLTSCDGRPISLTAVDDFIPSVGEPKDACARNTSRAQDTVPRNDGDVAAAD